MFAICASLGFEVVLLQHFLYFASSLANTLNFPVSGAVREWQSLSVGGQMDQWWVVIIVWLGNLTFLPVVIGLNLWKNAASKIFSCTILPVVVINLIFRLLGLIEGDSLFRGVGRWISDETNHNIAAPPVVYGCTLGNLVPGTYIYSEVSWPATDFDKTVDLACKNSASEWAGPAG